MDPEAIEDSESDSSESAGVMMVPGMPSSSERMHPALQAQLLRAQQRRTASSLRGIQQGIGASMSSVQPKPPVQHAVSNMFSNLQALQSSFQSQPPTVECSVFTYLFFICYEENS